MKNRENDDVLPAALVHRVREARDLVVLTGAGVSAESGIPTFRDAMSGLWARYDPSRLATPEAFAEDPALVTRWYDERRRRCGAAEPNAGHEALAHLERRLEAEGRRLTLLTQNVDRLHHRAGSRRVVELHGTLWIWRCVTCGEERLEEAPEPFDTYPPRCACGGLRRPAVVWFGEMLPPDALEQAHRALTRSDLFLSVGTSAVVEPAASFVHTARRHGATTAEINPQPTPITPRVDFSVRATSASALGALAGRAPAGRRSRK